MDNHYRGVIWTNHALDRLRQRGISQGDAWATWSNPQQSRKGTSPGSWVYYRNYGNTQIEVVAKQNEKKEWLILSVWSRPSYQNDLSQTTNTSFWKNLLKLLGVKK